MNDQSVELLVQQLAPLTGKCLIVADENWASTAWNAVAHSGTSQRVLFSNRDEIARGAQATGMEAQFNDFDFSTLEPASFDHVLFRVSKERAVTHHIINCASALLKDGGQLILSGEKTDGIKTYTDAACQLFGDSSRPQKNGIYYLSIISKYRVSDDPLDDKDYTQLRAINTKPTLFSKPGIFGWNKVDQGSAFLIGYLPKLLERYPAGDNAKSLLDLGCGYGYLACSANEFGFERIVATDNNAAALLACNANFNALGIAGVVVAGDAGSELNERFDTIVCNPPFHQGFNIDSALTEKFLSATKRLITSRGRALFVVNNFIALEKKARDYFSCVEEVGRSGSFKLIMVAHKP